MECNSLFCNVYAPGHGLHKRWGVLWCERWRLHPPWATEPRTHPPIAPRAHHCWGTVGPATRPRGRVSGFRVSLDRPVDQQHFEILEKSSQSRWWTNFLVKPCLFALRSERFLAISEISGIRPRLQKSATEPKRLPT